MPLGLEAGSILPPARRSRGVERDGKDRDRAKAASAIGKVSVTHPMAPGTPPWPRRGCRPPRRWGGATAPRESGEALLWVVPHTGPFLFTGTARSIIRMAGGWEAMP